MRLHTLHMATIARMSGRGMYVMIYICMAVLLQPVVDGWHEV